MLTCSAKRQCIMPVAGNLCFGILQLGEVLTLWQLIITILNIIFETSWYFTKFSFHHKGNEAWLLVTTQQTFVGLQDVFKIYIIYLNYKFI